MVPGKLFAIDSNTGSIVWSSSLPDFAKIKCTHTNLYALRTSAHRTPMSVVIGNDGGGSFAFAFDPITGATLTATRFPYQVVLQYLQSMTSINSIRTVLIVNEQY